MECSCGTYASLPHALVGCEALIGMEEVVQRMRNENLQISDFLQTHNMYGESLMSMLVDAIYNTGIQTWF